MSNLAFVEKLERAERVPQNWKATKEYLNQRGTKIRVFRALLGPFPSFFPPLSPLGPVHSPTTFPLLTSPLSPPALTPGKTPILVPL